MSENNNWMKNDITWLNMQCNLDSFLFSVKNLASSSKKWWCRFTKLECATTKVQNIILLKI